jgi:hypothetical protein
MYKGRMLRTVSLDLYYLNQYQYHYKSNYQHHVSYILHRHSAELIL